LSNLAKSKQLPIYYSNFDQFTSPHWSTVKSTR